MGCKLSKVVNPTKITKTRRTKKANNNSQIVNKQSRVVKNSLESQASRESIHSSKSKDAVIQLIKKSDQILSRVETTGGVVADNTHEDDCVEQLENVPEIGSNVNDKVDVDQTIHDYGIYDDDGNEENDDEELFKSDAHLIRVRPMAAKGERVIIENSPMVARIKKVDKDVENLISHQSSAVNIRDKRFRPKAAKGVKTPSWSSSDRCRTPVGMVLPTYSRHCYNQRGLVVYQANCLNEWMLRQNEKVDSQE